MSGWKLHITGASCSGVSTLGAALAERLGMPQIDVDDYYWMPTDPPFNVKRPTEDRVRLICQQQAMSKGWILTGSCMIWGDVVIRAADLIVFVYTPTATRLMRLDRRETERHGQRIAPGGDMHATHVAFRNWATLYENPGAPGRSLEKHNAWLAKQHAPILRLDGLKSTEELASEVEQKLSGLQEGDQAG